MKITRRQLRKLILEITAADPAADLKNKVKSDYPNKRYVSHSFADGLLAPGLPKLFMVKFDDGSSVYYKDDGKGNLTQHDSDNLRGR